MFDAHAFEQFQNKDDIVQLCKRVNLQAKREFDQENTMQNPNGALYVSRVFYTHQHAKLLTGLWYYVLYQKRYGLPIDHAVITIPFVTNYLYKLEVEEPAVLAAKNITRPGPFIPTTAIVTKWPAWSEAFNNYMRTVLGSNNTPL